jgi:hypothetical protein
VVPVLAVGLLMGDVLTADIDLDSTFANVTHAAGAEAQEQYRGAIDDRK